MSNIHRTPAPPLGAVTGDIVTKIFELVALHLRRTIPAVSHFTLTDLVLAMEDLRPQIGVLLDSNNNVDDDEED